MADQQANVATYESDSAVSDSEKETTSRATTPPGLEEFERWQAHIGLQRFGEGLNAAAKAIFPNDGRPRYSKVSVLMLSWKDEETSSPESEIAKLATVLTEVYHFDVELWSIPRDGSKAETNQKISEFIGLGGDSDAELKIFYYAGQTRLIKNNELALTRSVHHFLLSTV